MLNPSFIESCFGENYIGIRGYCNDQSESGYYINDEVNITQKVIAKIASSDDVKSSELIKRLLRNAVRDTANDFLQYLEKYGYYLTKNVNYCKTVKSDLSKQLKINELGRYMAVKVEFVQVPEAATLYIDYDGSRETISLSSGVNRLNKIIIGDAVNFHFDSNTPIIQIGEIPDDRYYFNTELEDEYSVTGLTGEVVFRLSGVCSFEKLICENKHLLSRAIFYHSVGLFFKEKWQSDKIDPLVVNSKEESEEMYREFLWGFEDKPSKYHEALKFAVMNLRQNLKKNHCFTCTGIKVQSLI